MEKLIKRILFIGIMLLFSICINVYAEEKINIEIIPSQEEISRGDKVNVQFNVNSNIPTSCIQINFQYNKNVFEKVTEDEFQKIGRWNWPTIGIEEDEDSYFYSILVDRNSDMTEIGTILDFNLKVKEDASSLANPYIKIYYVESTNKSISPVIKEEKDIVYTFKSADELYLKSNVYKVGYNDKYITRISYETTISKFIQNLQTNGNITIYDGDTIVYSDNTDKTLGNYEIESFIKTGMKIKVTKQGFEDINLILTVIGDIDGNGKVTVTDLATINACIIKEISLDEKQTLAADISDDNKITVTDLAAMNQIILKEIIL